jgi:hypothetical protein
LGDRLGDRARAIRLGCPNPPSTRAEAELHQAPFGQATDGNASALGSPYDGARARAEAYLLGQGLELRELRQACDGQLERSARCELESSLAHFLFGELDEQSSSVVRHRKRIAEGDRGADRDLQRKRVLSDAERIS